MNILDLGLEEYFSGIEVTNTDDYPLGDLHLNSAINLDSVQQLVNPGQIPYKIMESFYLQRDYDHWKLNLKQEGYVIIVGVIQTMMEVLWMSQEQNNLDCSITPIILKNIQDSLNGRGIHIPISLHNVGDILSGTQFPSSWVYNFNTILHMTETISEMKRGGKNSIHKDVRVDSMGASGTLIRADKTRIEMKCYQNLTVFSFDKCHYLGNFETLLLILDVLGQRICALLCSRSLINLPVSGTIPEDVLINTFSFGDHILKLCGNPGYEILSMYEACIVGTILLKNPDSITDSHQFINSCIDELTEICTHVQSGPSIMQHIGDFLRYLQSIPTKVLSNLFCLYRVWGHPVISVYEGMEKVYTVGTTEKYIDESVSNDLLHQFKKMFLMSYFQKHYHYPCTVITGDCYITQRIHENARIHDNDPGFLLSDFQYVELQQIWQIPSSYDICHILNDKAVSPTRQELVSNIRNGKGTMCGNLRRGIYRWLMGDSIRCDEFLRNIDNYGLDEDSLIIGMYEKEREVKIKARMFSLMSEMMRYYFVITEEMIASKILPYFPEITMKDPLNILTKKLWTLGGKRSLSGLGINVNIDFVKWCTNMRDELTHSIFAEMDKLFGYTRVISRTHEFFRNSFIYSSSGKYVPTLDSKGLLASDPPMAYYGHLGGFEGLRQKGWTIATVCLLVHISDTLRLRIGLMGQGDNQIIRVQMPTSKWIGMQISEQAQINESKHLLSTFLSTMESQFSLAKLPIKIRETWSSQRLFMYGKVMLFDGQVLPQWIKKILRSYALSNEGTLTVAGVVGTIATNCMSAGSLSDAPDLMYCIYLLLAEWSIRSLLDYHPFTRQSIVGFKSYTVNLPSRKKRSTVKIQSLDINRLVASMLVVPTSIGGSITIPMTGFIFRGFPDKASEGYAWLKLLSETNTCFQSLWTSWYTFLQNETIEPDMLIQSPWSLNHLKPKTPGIQSREIVREWLYSGQFSQNTVIKNMQFISSKFDRKSVCESLLTDPINPLVTHEIYETFPQVYLDSVSRRLENTRTIRNFALSHNFETPVYRKLMELEHNFILYLAWRSNKTGVKFSHCPTEQARIARNIGWGRDIIGITTPHPIELMHIKTCNISSPCHHNEDYIYVKIDQSGDFSPYLGSRVTQKVFSLQDEDLRREPLISRVAKVARFINWLGIGENLTTIVLNNTHLVCDISIYDTFIDDDPEGDLYTGSVAHRFTPAAASEGCFINYVPQLGQSVFMSGENMPTYGKGRNNFTLHFQAMYCYLQYIHCRNTFTPYSHHHIDCTTCVVPVVDTIPDLTSFPDVFIEVYSKDVIEKLIESLGYISERPDIKVLDERQVKGLYVNINDVSSYVLQEGIYEHLSYKCAQSITYSNQKLSGDVGLEDLQDYPRVYSYKLYRNELIFRVSLKMILMQSINTGEIPVGLPLNRIKRRVQDILLLQPLSAFKQLASLCLGRKDRRKYKGSVVLVEGFSYPETTIDFLRGIKSSLILTVSSIGKIRPQRLPICPISVEGMSQYDHTVMVAMYISIERGCYQMLLHCKKLKENRDEITLKNCSHHCLNWGFRRVPLLLASIDKAMKLIPQVENKYAKSTRHHISNLANMFHINDIFQEIDNNIQMLWEKPIFDLGKYRYIQLPTSSIYKWETIASRIQKHNKIIVLGDGTGGTSLVFSRHYQESTVYPLSLMESKMLIPQDLTSLTPALVRGIQNISIELLLNLPDDIYNAQWTDFFSREIIRFGLSNILIVSDIEEKTGNISSTLKIIGTVPTGCRILLKCYIHELVNYTDIPMTECILFLTPLANLKYGECFIYGVKSTRKKSSVPQIINIWNGWVKELSMNTYENSILEMTRIESSYPDLVDLSVTLAISHLHSLSVTVTRDLIILPEIDLLMYIARYISSHYHFTGSNEVVQKSRVITSLLKSKLERCLQIILLAISSEQLLHREDFWKYGLMNILGSARNKPQYKTQYRYIGRNSNILSKTDHHVSKILRNHRIRHNSGVNLDIDMRMMYDNGPLSKEVPQSMLWSISGVSSFDSIETIYTH